MPPDPDLARAFDFVQRADMCGTRVAPWSLGQAVFLPDLPLRHDSNYLVADALPADTDVPALLEEVHAVQGAAGLRHRLLMVRDAASAEPFVDAFRKRGWTIDRGAVMAHRRPAERAVDLGRTQRSDEVTLEAARTANILGYAWSTPEVARQLLAARRYASSQDEVYAVFEGGEPVAWAELYHEGGVAQVESVATLASHRNRGHASALVLRCVAEARRKGAGLVFLVADADDWPRHLYARLGFDEIGRYLKFHLDRA